MYPFKGNQMFNPPKHEHHIQPPDPVHHVAGPAGLVAPPPPILNTQWPLNKAAYQDLANDQVDWASLAQQWIHMKETCTTEDLLAAPPPPIISRTGSNRLEEEKGEAPMEMDRDDEDHNVPSTSHNNPFSVPPGMPSVLPRLNQPPPNWNPANNQPGGDAQSQWQHTPPPNAAPHHWNKKHGWNTWTNPNIQSVPPHLTYLIAPANPLVTHPHNDNWPLRGSHSNPRHTTNRPENPEQIINSGSNSPNSSNDMSQTPVALDAAKRKTLPTWIRLGLEKMEREKQKSIEQDEKDRLNREKLDRQKQELLAISSDIALGSKSKFDSDSHDSSDNEDQRDKSVLLRRDDAPKRMVPAKSRQDQLQELMLLVRSSLTEILLEVTNEEIRSIATETLSKVRQKARTAQTVKKSALTSLTGGLGLGIYADSDGSDDEAGTSGDDSHNDSEPNAGDESDKELRETIKRRKKAFEERSKEIEAQVAAEAERERRWLEDEPQNASTSVVASMGAAHSKLVANSRRGPRGAHDTDIGEVQQHEQKFIPSHAHRPAERKVSRFSDPKDTVKNLQLTHGSLIYESTATKAITIIPQPNPSGPPPHHSDSDQASVASSKATSVRSATRRKADSKRSKRHRDSDEESDSSRRKNRDRKEKRRNRSRSRSSSSDRSTRRRNDASRSSKKRRSSRDSRVSSSRSNRRSESRETSKSGQTKRSERRRDRSRSDSRDRKHHRY